MLAYLFWHTPRPTVARSDYERDLLALSRACRLVLPGGETDHKLLNLHRAVARRSIRLRGLGHDDGSCALETLNEQAVSGSMAELHGTVAQQTGVGYGGVYYRLWGNMDPHVAERAQ